MTVLFYGYGAYYPRIGTDCSTLVNEIQILPRYCGMVEWGQANVQCCGKVWWGRQMCYDVEWWSGVRANVQCCGKVRWGQGTCVMMWNGGVGSGQVCYDVEWWGES